MPIYLDTPCDKCIHRRENLHGWKGCCDAFPDGWPPKWLQVDVLALEECNNGIKYEPEEKEDED